jgi:starvation-inducible DNA-binding protein
MSKKDKAVIEALEKLLADTYTLYLKTQNYHWNVTGPSFNSLHTLFQAQYEDMILANDLIAERIRALGEKAPGSFKAFLKITDITEENGTPKATEMVKNLAKDQETLIASAKALLEAAEAVGDEPTVDLAIGRQEVHQKNHWMLKAHLE